MEFGLRQGARARVSLLLSIAVVLGACSSAGVPTTDPFPSGASAGSSSAAASTGSSASSAAGGSTNLPASPPAADPEPDTPAVAPVIPVNHPPAISGTAPASITVGQQYAFSPGASDADGDVLVFSVRNLPAWADFDSITGNLSGTPGDVDVGAYHDIIIEVSDGADSVSLPAFDIDVLPVPIVVPPAPTPQPVNTPPRIAGTPAATVEAGSAYNFLPVARDDDGDPLTFQVANLPSWAAFDRQTGHIGGTPGAGDIGHFDGILISVTDGTDTVSLPAFSIQVVAAPLPTVNHPPWISGTPASVAMSGSAYSFSPTAGDVDGDAIWFVISNRPTWLAFNATTGAVNGIPSAADVGYARNITIGVTDGQQTTWLNAFTIQVVAAPVTPANSAPTISGSPATSVVAGSNYSFVPVARDADGDALTFSIQNKPSWANFNTSTGQLSGVPTLTNVGSFTGIIISVSDGQRTARLAVFTIVVTAPVGTAPTPTPPVNHAPGISGSPATSVTAGSRYSFTPGASDADGDTLTFSVQNKPSWASFNSRTGQLSGTPTTGDVGSFAGIVISVSDGQQTTGLLAFTIVVTAPAPPVNHAPSISGSPATSVTAGFAYAFVPGASDADGDALTFSIQNKPSWASFNTGTGQLSGTPTTGNVGSFAGIVISVSDGRQTAMLPSFTIVVTPRIVTAPAPPANHAPSISGSPVTNVTAGSAYSFIPSASDSDGDALTFSIQNKPSWASFNTGTGQLAGSPGAGDVGGFSGIIISVSDGKASNSLALFSITVDPAATGSGNITPVVEVSRTNGVGPLAVWFDASATVDPNVAHPFHDLSYKWSFGDAGAGSWPVGGNTSKNVAFGPVAAHVFESPGTYTVTLTVSDGTSSATQRTTISVSDPNTVYAGTNTICLKNAAGNSDTACPSGATVMGGISNFATAISTYQGNGKRLLFKRGDTFSASYWASITSSNLTVGAYGSGAKPVLQLTTSTQVFLINASAGARSDIRLMDMKWNGNNYSGARGISSFASSGTVNASQITVLRVDVVGMEIGMGPSGNQVAVVDSTITNVSTNASSSSGAYGMFIQNLGAAHPRYFALLGTTINLGAAASGGQRIAVHGIRGDFFKSAVFENNNLVGNRFSSVRINAPNWSSDPTYTEKVVVADNYFDGSSTSGNADLYVEPGTNGDQRFRDILLERNYLVSGAGSASIVLRSTGASGYPITVRNNLVDITGTSGFEGASLDTISGGTTPVDNHFYNNTFFSNTATGFTAIRMVRTDSVGTIVRNNLAYAPHATGAPTILTALGTALTQSNNSTTSDITSGILGFLLPTTALGFKVSCIITYPCQQGTAPAAVGVFYDYFGNPRTAPLDLGAINH